MIIILITIIVLIVLYHSYQLYKQHRANKELKELYMKRFGESERVERLIREKPENIILATEICESKIPLRYIGRFDSLDKVSAKNGDCATMNELQYWYKDGKWYEVVDDLSYLQSCTFGDYRIRY